MSSSPPTQPQLKHHQSSIKAAAERRRKIQSSLTIPPTGTHRTIGRDKGNPFTTSTNPMYRKKKDQSPPLLPSWIGAPTTNTAA